MTEPRGTVLFKVYCCRKDIGIRIGTCLEVSKLALRRSLSLFMLGHKRCRLVITAKLNLLWVIALQWTRTTTIICQRSERYRKIKLVQIWPDKEWQWKLTKVCLRVTNQTKLDCFLILGLWWCLQRNKISLLFYCDR